MKLSLESSYPSGKYTNLCALAQATLPQRKEVLFRVVKGHASRVIDSITGEALHLSAAKIGAQLSTRFPPQSRILLCFPAGLEFIRVFYACIFSGMIAVPLPLPGGRRTVESLAKVADDCAAVAVVGPETVLNGLKRGTHQEFLSLLPPLLSFEELAGQRTDVVDPITTDFPASRVGWLQYTSGSTGSPKGVVITHANALANSRMMYEGCFLAIRPVVASWLPHFHDMGLLMGIIGPLTFNGTAVLTSPLDFMGRPQIWLEMIHHWKATTTAVPNFGLDHCVQKARLGETPLNFSSLSTLVVGAEPVRKATLEKFISAFGCYGLQEAAIMPGYGLAESTLYVSSGRGVEDWQDNVCCGIPLEDQVVALIVDPITKQLLPAGEEGEIWLNGPSIAAGYWGRAEESEAAFQARLQDSADQRAFLRTGDLGVVSPKGLVITARLKDLLIVRGLNVSPYDIEDTIIGFGLELGIEAVAVFQDSANHIVAVIEVPKGIIPDPALPEKIKLRVATDHQVDLDRIVFIKRHGLPRTSSGKIQRKLTAQALNKEELGILLDRRFEEEVDLGFLESLIGQTGTPFNENTLLSELGLDSLKTVTLVEKINRKYQKNLSVAEFYELTTVGKVIHRLGKTTSSLDTISAKAGPVDDTKWVVSGIGLRLGSIRSIPDFWQSLSSPENFFSDRDGWTAAWTKGIFRFDAKFFKISGREASTMDPQQRWLLSATVEALLDADHTTESLKGKSVGVFIGLSTSDFYRVLDIDLPRAGTGIAHCLAANRISHYFNWTGPSQVIDCACSSSLVAVDSAMKALRDGSCDAAIVGGANFIFSHDLFRSFEKAGMLSPERVCRPFDLRASGYVRGEGCGVVLIESEKTLQQEKRPGYATILGAAVRHNGQAQSLTAPNGESQRMTILDALNRAQAQPSQVDYVEAHGTGTPLGDGIELRALRLALAQNRSAPLVIGSIKSLYGHLEAAAGIIGLIKAILIRNQHQTTPQSAWTEFTPLMKEVLGTDAQIRLSRQSQPLPSANSVIGVSSFGFGGTNAHAVISPPPEAIESHLIRPIGGNLWNESCCAPEVGELLASMTIRRENDWD
jgi:iturin family lipopeptide synthetase A